MDKQRVQSLEEVYSELFHYTTATGLEGILKDKCIWATHCRYLNDSSEFTHFFGDKLKQIVNVSVDETIGLLDISLPPIASLINKAGGIEKLSRDTKDGILEFINKGKWDLLYPYLTSFCGVRAEDEGTAKDGLLSQWRGYGSDGGYAIVFDIKPFITLLEKDYSRLHYAYLRFGDVEYHNTNGSANYQLPEMQKLEESVKHSISQFIQTGDPAYLQGTALPIVAMASTQKHHGFSEEREVRIIGAPMAKAELNKLDAKLLKSKKPVEQSFHLRSGLFVPHLTLFKGLKLPIKRVIVGPHADKDKRAESVRMLLEKYRVDAKVSCSDIPYIGK